MRWVLLLVVFLAACSPQVTVKKLPPEERQPDLIPSAPVEPVPQQDLPPTSLSAWQSVVHNASKTTNYQVDFTRGDRAGATLKVRAHLARLRYRKPVSLATGKTIDTVFFDREQERAVGFCRDPGPLCKPYRVERFPLSYREFYELTPRDWVLRFASRTPEYVPEAEIVNGILTDKFVFRDQVTTTLFINPTMQLPVRVVEQASHQRIQYDFVNLHRGTVSAKDVFH